MTAPDRPDNGHGDCFEVCQGRDLDNGQDEGRELRAEVIECMSWAENAAMGRVGSEWADTLLSRYEATLTSRRAGAGAHDRRPDVLAAKLLATLAGDPRSWPGLHTDAAWLLQLIRTLAGHGGVGEQQREVLAGEIARHGFAIGVDQRLVLCTCSWRHQSEANLTRPLLAWSRHVADELLAVLGGTQPDGGER